MRGFSGVVFVWTLAVVIATVMADRHQHELKEHYDHLAYIAEFNCHWPQPRVVSVHELFSAEEIAHKAFFPDVTVLHLCDNAVGCCPSNHYCRPKHTHPLHLPFKVTFLEHMGKHKKGSWVIDYHNFVNHTECECVDASVCVPPTDHDEIVHIGSSHKQNHQSEHHSESHHEPDHHSQSSHKSDHDCESHHGTDHHTGSSHTPDHHVEPDHKPDHHTGSSHKPDHHVEPHHETDHHTGSSHTTDHHVESHHEPNHHSESSHTDQHSESSHTSEHHSQSSHKTDEHGESHHDPDHHTKRDNHEEPHHAETSHKPDHHVESSSEPGYNYVSFSPSKPVEYSSTGDNKEQQSESSTLPLLVNYVLSSTPSPKPDKVNEKDISSFFD